MCTGLDYMRNKNCLSFARTCVHPRVFCGVRAIHLFGFVLSLICLFSFRVLWPYCCLMHQLNSIQYNYVSILGRRYGRQTYTVGRYVSTYTTGAYYLPSVERVHSILDVCLICRCVRLIRIKYTTPSQDGTNKRPVLVELNR